MFGKQENRNIRNVAVRFPAGIDAKRCVGTRPSSSPMTTKVAASLTPAQKKLVARVGVAQKQAAAAKKTAKLAKQKFKDAKHAAKKSRKAVKALKAELAKLMAKKSAAKPAAKKPAARRSRKFAAVAPAPVELSPSPVDTPPGADSSAPAQ
jgi:hypothetical protein